MSSDRRAEIRRRQRQIRRDQNPPQSHVGPNRAQRRDLVRKNPLGITRSELRRRGLASRGNAAR